MNTTNQSPINLVRRALRAMRNSEPELAAELLINLLPMHLPLDLLKGIEKAQNEVELGTPATAELMLEALLQDWEKLCKSPPAQFSTPTKPVELRLRLGSVLRKSAYVRAARPGKLEPWAIAQLDKAADYSDKCQLIIHSLHDADLACSCGRWTLVSARKMSREEALEAHRLHTSANRPITDR